jgi:D-aminopeptidase
VSGMDNKAAADRIHRRLRSMTGGHKVTRVELHDRETGGVDMHVTVAGKLEIPRPLVSDVAHAEAVNVIEIKVHED